MFTRSGYSLLRYRLPYPILDNGPNSMLYQVLTGELPTLIEEAVEARDKKSRPVTFMGDVILKLPPSLPDPDNPIWDLARRCLALSPKKRPKLDEIHQILCDYHLSDFSFRIPPATIDATESSD